MQNLMSSLPGEMRQQLGDMMQQLMGEMGMEQELAQLAQNLEALYPMRDLLNQYPFRGQEEIDLQAAMSLMGDMQQLDELERAAGACPVRRQHRRHRPRPARRADG